MTLIKEAPSIPWWNITFGEDEVQRLISAVRNRNISQGLLTEELERKLAERLRVAHVICTTSGTAALTMAFMALGIGPGDEVILPNRTWVATAHAAMILGARIRLVDVRPDRPLIDENVMGDVMTKKTKAIVPVHLNGRAANVMKLHKIAEKYAVAIVEDAAQALFSQLENQYLGTLSRFGCFSMSMAKLLSSGQGGFVVCHNHDDAMLLKRIRNQGVLDVTRDTGFDILAGNFKFTDIQAALILAQLPKVEERIGRQKTIYELYKEGLKDTKCLKLVEVRVDQGELPLRAEFLCKQRELFIQELKRFDIVAIPQAPNLCEMPHIQRRSLTYYKNSECYSRHLLTLPCGPDQPLENIKEVIRVIKQISFNFEPW